MLTGTGQVTSCIPTLGPFCTWVSLVPVLELRSSALIPFCQAVLVIWGFSSLSAYLTGLATFLVQAESDAGERECRPLEVGEHKKPQCGRSYFAPGGSGQHFW